MKGLHLCKKKNPKRIILLKNSPYLLNDPQVRGSLNKFPDIFHMGIFIDTTHMKL